MRCLAAVNRSSGPDWHSPYGGLPQGGPATKSWYAILQDIDDSPPFQITDHPSVTPAAPPGPVIDPDHLYMTRFASRSGPGTSKERTVAATDPGPNLRVRARDTDAQGAKTCFRPRALDPDPQKMTWSTLNRSRDTLRPLPSREEPA